MGSLLSAESTAAPGEMAFLRDGWLSYVSIWQRGVGNSKYFNWAKQIRCEFYIEILKKEKPSLDPVISKMAKCESHLSNVLVPHRRETRAQEGKPGTNSPPWSCSLEG